MIVRGLTTACTPEIGWALGLALARRSSQTTPIPAPPRARQFHAELPAPLVWDREQDRHQQHRHERAERLGTAVAEARRRGDDPDPD